MAVSKLSQITASAPGGITDQIVGVKSGTTDALYSVEQILDTFGSTQGDLLYRDSAQWKVLAPGSANNVLISGGAAANPSWDGLSALIDTVFGSTQGDILYRGAAVWAVLAPGTNGQFLTSGGAAANPSWTTGGGGSPGGSNTDVQFNNSSAFGGDSGFTYAGSGQATLALGTITANAIALNITGTWNNSGVTFDAPLFMNITNTASNSASLLVDFQVSGSSKVTINVAGQVATKDVGSTFAPSFQMGSTAGIYTRDGFVTNIGNGASTLFEIGNSGLGVGLTSLIGWASNAKNDATDLSLYRDAAGILAQRNSTNAQTFRVYNTYTDSSNYERGVFDWTTTANVLTIGTQAGGTGTVRALQITAGANVANVAISAASLLIGTNAVPTGYSGAIMSIGNGNGDVVIFNNGILRWSPNSGYVPDAGINRAAAKVLKFSSDGSSTDTWWNWAGQARVTSDVTYTSTAALANITGLTVNVAAGRTYSFEAYLSFTDAAAGGIQAAIAGTATATAIEYDGWIIDSGANGIKGNTQATSLGTAVATATTTGTAGVVLIKGTITVNAAGTLTVQAAQNTSNGTPTTIKRGSYFLVYDMP